MKSQQVMLTLALLLVSGCIANRPPADRLQAPYEGRRLLAIVPFRNESGSLYADSFAMADHAARQLEEASHLDVLPVNRTIAAMEQLGIYEVTSPNQALALLEVLNADGLVVGTISAYDPYDPPKLGLAMELYLSPRYLEQVAGFDTRQLSKAATDEMSRPPINEQNIQQPVSSVSAILDASDPRVRELLKQYAIKRGAPDTNNAESWKRYRMSMNLYSEFCHYELSKRMLAMEARRLGTKQTAEAKPTR